MIRQVDDVVLDRLEAVARETIRDGFDLVTEGVNALDLLAVCLEVRHWRAAQKDRVHMARMMRLFS